MPLEKGFGNNDKRKGLAQLYFAPPAYDLGDNGKASAVLVAGVSAASSSKSK
ncbi:hypothetical protein SAMN04488032_112132 [Pacificibacter marinus]|uniref:Uncharacterized protein n=1 Tax=Pacificibacter marinus TaxID=658057 RepID=A0A1Y5TK09_9RHOB|nr:hypothetical protein SAMN04488032_112132 [Pacificibacter marinus]SLN62228.1 hypothetical protein PAM7971_03224 [Pacificibacter marinus]